MSLKQNTKTPETHYGDLRMRLAYGVLGLAFVLLVMLASSGAKAALEDRNSADSQSALCLAAVAKAEAEAGLPRHLLSAISIAESGRWNPDSAASLAWPWTVTSGGPGKFFPNAQAALAYVQDLQAQGVTNIDVGCMQINLYHHGSAFPSPEHALYPDENATYAAEFLKSLFDRYGSWTAATGAYHSTTPDRNRAYRLKVSRIWRELRQSDNAYAHARDAILKGRADTDLDREIDALVADETPDPVTQPPARTAVDLDRTRELNASLRERRLGQRLDPFIRGSAQLRQAAVRLEQIRAWRDNRGDLQAQDVERVMREARRKLVDEKTRLQDAARDRVSIFEAKRRAQLDRWRQTGSLHGQ
ncbi:MAG: lytic transglycosylase domain-containing protein [Rhodospirillales bacterium]